MKYAIGCDEAAVEMKNALKKYLIALGQQVEDFGTEEGCAVSYPDVGYAVAQAVAEKKADRAVLCCGTGIGMAICANKVNGIRAAVCHDLFSTERARMSNDAQIFCVGARVIAPEHALRLLDIWHHAEFQGGGSAEKVERIHAYEHSK